MNKWNLFKKLIFILFWPFVTSKNERQIAVRELSQPFACVRHRSRAFATVRSGSQPFAVVRSRSPPFAAVRHRSQWFAAVRSGSPPFAVSLKLNILYSFNKIRETKNIKSLFFIFKINNFELKKIFFKMKNLKKGNCLISWSSTSNTDYFKSFPFNRV